MYRISQHELQWSSSLCQLISLRNHLSSDFQVYLILLLGARHFLHELPLLLLNSTSHLFKNRKCKQGSYHPICDSIWIHSHFWIHTDEIPPKGLTLELLPQGLPLRNITNINSRVLYIKQKAEKKADNALQYTFFLYILTTQTHSSLQRLLWPMMIISLWSWSASVTHTLWKCP